MQINRKLWPKPGRKWGLEMAELMKLADKDFKTATINVTKDLKENMMRKMEWNERIKLLEVNNIEMKTSLDRNSSKLNSVKEKITELSDITTETIQTEINFKKWTEIQQPVGRYQVVLYMWNWSIIIVCGCDK